MGADEGTLQALKAMRAELIDQTIAAHNGRLVKTTGDGLLVEFSSEPAKKSGQNIPKNRCRTTIAERMGETPTELPFIGDQVVCLSHNQAAPQRAEEGGAAIKWTRLSCRTFAANAVRLQLHALAYNLGNLMRTLAMPKAAEPWSLTSLREKLIKIGAKVVSHGRYVSFQLAEVAVSRQMFQEILSLIARLRAPPAPA